MLGRVARSDAQEWLTSFEAGSLADGRPCDLLLKLIAATQPPRPDWWDSGHDHDLNLNLPSRAVRNRHRHPEYWRKIEAVHERNRLRTPGAAGGRMIRVDAATSRHPPA